LKKAQLQIKESILVLFVVMFILLFGMMLFFRYTSASIEKDMTDYKEAKFKQLISYIPSMAELKCSRFNVEDECIDVMKMEAFAHLSDDYKADFGDKKIIVKEVFPDEKSWEIYNNVPSDLDGLSIISTPVSLYYADTGEYAVGVLVVEWYR